METNEQHLISIIVPIYNVGRYLKQCLESIQRQTYKNIEVILVNDGSTDDSESICKEFVADDNRFKLISKENQGLGLARNTGLDNISLESLYITFIDSDDWVEENYVEILYNNLISNDSDICIVNRYDFVENEGYFLHYMAESDSFVENYSIERLFEEFYDLDYNKTTIFSTFWGKLYKRELFDFVRCPSIRKVEDAIILYKVYLLSSKVTYINQGLYCYRRRDSGITASAFSNEQWLFDWLEVQEERLAMLAAAGYSIENHVEHYRESIGFIENNARVSGMEHTEAYRRIKEKMLILENSRKNKE